MYAFSICNILSCPSNNFTEIKNTVIILLNFKNDTNNLSIDVIELFH